MSLIRPARRPRARGPAGFTLIETGLVLGVLGLILLLVADYSVMHLRQGAERQRVELAIMDVRSLADAVRAYAAANNGVWPNSGAAKVVGDQNRSGSQRVTLVGLHGAGYVRLSSLRLRFPASCGTNRDQACSFYTFAPWIRTQRSQAGYGALADYTFAEHVKHGAVGFDLMIFFGIPGDFNDPVDLARAQAIADRLPLGSVGPGVQANEIRIYLPLFYLGDTTIPGRRYIALDGEERPVVFEYGRGVISGVRRIAVETQLRHDLDTEHALITGPGIRFKDKEVLLMQDDGLVEDEAALVFSSPNAAGTRITFTVADQTTPSTSRRSAPDNTTVTFSAVGKTHQPVFAANSSHIITENVGMAMRLETPSGKEAHWDMTFQHRPSHNSLQTRLCALEGALKTKRDEDEKDLEDDEKSTDNPVDVTCPS